MSAHASSAGFDARDRPLPFRALNFALERGERFMPLPRLDPAALMREARARTRLDEFGPADYVEPLEVLCDSIEREARLHPIGRLILRGRIRGALETRLRAEAMIRRHPEILDIPIEAPIVIAGLQRTGTTMLHRLLASDPRVRSLASWEALSPVPERLGAPRDRDPRIRAAVLAEKGLKAMAPEFFAIHPVEAHAPEEEVILLDLAFRSTAPEATMHVPTYARWLESNDPVPAYRYLERMLKVLTFQHRRDRWVLKTPHHLEFLDALLTVFPDAKIIQTHRDPRKSLASFASMVAHGRAVFSDEVDAREVGRHWGRKITRMVRHGMASRAAHPDVRVLDVSYYDLVREPIAEVERVFRFAGLSFEAETREAALATKKKNPKGKYGAHAYRLEDFGLDAAFVEENLGEYRARHAIPVE
jgi:hypothetical protein